MIAYEGKEPYVFVSYSHRDADRVVPIIGSLKQDLCRVWYDEGLLAGESWNDSIAEHLLNCEVFVVLLSPDSVKSKYVLAEINYALTKDKNIVPVLLRPTELPLSLEMMLGPIQFLDITKVDREVQIVSGALPRSVFSVTAMPFLQDLGYCFHMVTQDVERHETGVEDAATIFCEDGQGQRTELLSLKRLGAYEASYRISSVEPLKDYFYPGKVQGVYQINILGSFLLEYPLNGPDVQVLLILIMRIPCHGEPTLRLVDYQYMNSVSSLHLQDEEHPDVIGQKGWSTQIRSYLDKKQYV